MWLYFFRSIEHCRVRRHAISKFFFGLQGKKPLFNKGNMIWRKHFSASNDWFALSLPKAWASRIWTEFGRMRVAKLSNLLDVRGPSDQVSGFVAILLGGERVVVFRIAWLIRFADELGRNTSLGGERNCGEVEVSVGGILMLVILLVIENSHGSWPVGSIDFVLVLCMRLGSGDAMIISRIGFVMELGCARRTVLAGGTCRLKDGKYVVTEVVVSNFTNRKWVWWLAMLL